ncbi:MAG: acyl-CoA dehydrogenase [Spirochaeta sp.]|nr:acyl-CoA dehydrogenase [Spirochaeta sp.]RPG13833.1 MAG: acyl-CoA dehydrogenase [Proteobacteria bacterium TMED72]
MEFGLSEEQDLLQETVRQFVSEQCPPTQLHAIFDAGEGHAPALWQGVAELGLCGLMLPEEYGGADLEVLDLALVCEELAYGGLPGPFMMHSLAAHAIARAGDSDQRGRHLPALADGSAIATLALAEGEGAWRPEFWSTRSEGGVLHGTKRFVPHADLSDWIVVGLSDGRLALVEKGAAGLTVVPEEGIDRTRPIGRLEFEGTPCEVLEGDGAVLERIGDVGLTLLAADAFGSASRLIDLAVEYTKTREQFGRKVAEFQAVKHQLARLALEIEPTRALFWYAAHAVDHRPDEGPRSAALAKSHISDRAIQAGREVVELHGGIGFTWECDVHLWLKRIMFDRAFLGTPESLRERCAELEGW